MRKQHRLTAIRLSLFLLLAVSMAVIGISYASWSDSLTASVIISTGVFDMVFPVVDESYQVNVVELVGDQSSVIQTLEHKIRIKDGGKQAEISFGNGLPLDLLMNGYGICITYPLAVGDGTITAVKQYDVDFSQISQQVTFIPERQTVVISGQRYHLQELSDTYAIPLIFDVYKSLQRTADVLQGNVYLQLSEDSIERIRQTPQTAEVFTSQLDDALINEHNGYSNQNGILVEYSCMIPLTFDQE